MPKHERAAAMERVARIIEERRDDLARTLTLDQGKPLHAESYLPATRSQPAYSNCEKASRLSVILRGSYSP
jgi:acyl-CoA reductase-like NAD-dependent aldehyde dehydrogenase